MQKLILSMWGYGAVAHGNIYHARRSLNEVLNIGSWKQHLQIQLLPHSLHNKYQSVLLMTEIGNLRPAGRM
jgi:hypothetical protein